MRSELVKPGCDFEPINTKHMFPAYDCGRISELACSGKMAAAAVLFERMIASQDTLWFDSLNLVFLLDDNMPREALRYVERTLHAPRKYDMYGVRLAASECSVALAQKMFAASHHLICEDQRQEAIRFLESDGMYAEADAVRRGTPTNRASKLY